VKEWCRRVAILSDVHGNAVALAAVLEELDAAAPDLIVFGGDLSWGPLPLETLALARGLRTKAIFVRGNAERALAELADARERGADEPPSPRERWLLDQHGDEERAFLESFLTDAVVEIDGLGPTRFCHGSPRSDEELITFATPEARIRAALAGVDERMLVTAHTHIQFDRTVAGVRSVNPGSVGMPYEGRAGAAFWAVLGPDVELRQTDYDLAEAVRRYRASCDPLAEEMVELLERPPARTEVVEQAEAAEFAG
jgi:predicted phosphodiesterase